MRLDPIRLLPIFALSACASGEVEVDEPGEPTFVWEDDSDGHDRQAELSVLDLESKAGSCGTRWIPPADVVADGDGQSVRYDSAGARCSGGATAGSLAFADYLRDNFGGSLNREIPGDGVQIYACRNINGGSGLSVHATGRALDVFIPTVAGGAANSSKGDPLAHWLMRNASQIGVQFIIWNRTQWKASGDTPRSKCYGGAHPHNDHIHVELNTDGGAMRTPFFADSSNPPVQPPAAREAWVGDACDADAGCALGSYSGRCFLDHLPPNGLGFCTLGCDGFCPDSGGRAMTFCVEADAVGGRSGLGTCVSRSDDENDRCRRNPGFIELSAERFVGDSGASRASAVICAPENVTGVVDLPPPDPAAPSPNNGVCNDASLPLSENGSTCAGVPNDTWRCACSARFSASVSQVCRSGVWLNYELTPRDCGRCAGSYTSGCED